MKSIGKQQKIYLCISWIQFSLGFITVQGGLLCWLVSLIQVGSVTLIIYSLLHDMFSILVSDLSLVLVGNNTISLFPNQKQSIKPELMQVMKPYLFGRSFQSLDSRSNIWIPFGVTIRVSSSSPNIQFNINAANTLNYRCTSSESLFMIAFLKFSFSLQKIKLYKSSQCLLHK